MIALPLRAALTALLLALPLPAFAWGAAGHRMVGEIAAENFSPDLPAFLRKPGVARDIGEWAREPDRSKGAGRIHDTGRDPAHFFELDENGKVWGGPAASDLPPTREAYEKALQAVDTDSYRTGYLPYAIIDGWQQLVKDFTYWRILKAALRHEKDPARRAYYSQDIKRRESQTIQDLGIWAHFVGDGSQPLHMTIHRDGWGNYPNPKGYTNEKVHTPFEGGFVVQYITDDQVRAALPVPAPDCGCGIERWTTDYLIKTASLSETVYAMFAAGDFASGTRQGETFVSQRIAEGAAQLRDMTLAAWTASAKGKIGNPATLLISVDDAEAGKIDPYPAIHGMD